MTRAMNGNRGDDAPFFKEGIYMLVISRKVGSKLVIGDNIEVMVVRIAHGQVRLGITAPREIPVHRDEIQKRIEKQRKDDAA